ncbi:MAG TPA: hypothetical protein VHB97_05665 [Polyangia bacterium]|nr:hypothetical protein [Polyangia bacterium]
MRSFALVLLAGTVAHAQQPQASPTPATPPGAAVPSTPSPSAPTSPRAEPGKPPPSGSGDFNFELGGEAKPATPAESASEQQRLAKLERKVHIRRAMLQWHQALGFVTLAALAVTDVIGTLSYYDKYTAAGTDTGRFTTAHEWLAIGATTTFGVTGILALAAPNPYPKPLKLDAALLHKMSMLAATICFAAQIVMGPIMAVSDGKLFQKDMALAHVVIGYGAFAFMGVGTLAYVF